jgi:hypothetical protein
VTASALVNAEGDVSTSSRSGTRQPSNCIWSSTARSSGL